jgi:hypothetical protein
MHITDTLYENGIRVGVDSAAASVIEGVPPDRQGVMRSATCSSGLGKFGGDVPFCPGSEITHRYSQIAGALTVIQDTQNDGEPSRFVSPQRCVWSVRRASRPQAVLPRPRREQTRLGDLSCRKPLRRRDIEKSP